MTSSDHDVPAALEPVAQALRAAARTDANALVRAARQDAQTIRETAYADEQQRRAGARAAGEADARRTIAASRRQTRRAARRAVLEAQRDARTALRDAVLERLATLHDDPRYVDLVGRLSSTAQAALGPEARVTDHPSGGIVAVAPGRRLTLSLPALVDQQLEAQALQLEGRSTP